MKQRYYSTGQFAQKAGVSLRTLRYYDRVGLLSPARHTDANYRQYSQEDLLALQQILALKFLGFSLEEIKACLSAAPQHVEEALKQQKAMLREKRTQIDTIIGAIGRAEDLLAEGRWDWDSFVEIMEAIQMEKKKDWTNKYFTPEQAQKMQEISQASYSEEARQKLAPRSSAWTEEDQKRVDAQYAWLDAELKRLVAANADPAGPEAQAWAKVKHDLLFEFTQGDPDIQSGLNKWWDNFWKLPESERPMEMQPPSQEEAEFTDRAMAVFKEQQARPGAS